MDTKATFTVEIKSAKHGTFKVIAPSRFKSEIERHVWRVHYDKKGRGGCVRPCTTVRDGGACRRVSLHRMVWELAGRPETPIIDHIDHQPLNNAEDNLRAATVLQNNRNTRIRKDNASGVIGVFWDPCNKKWRAAVKSFGVTVPIGRFERIEDAVVARDVAAAKLHGEFATLNRMC